jgi:hypothetical protein
MVRPIVQHVAALTERAQILHPIVGRVAIQVRRCEHDARHPKPSRLHKIGPSGGVPLVVQPVQPRRCFFVEPASVRQAAKESQVRAATTLAFSSSAFEAHVVAQLTPVRGGTTHSSCNSRVAGHMTRGPVGGRCLKMDRLFFFASTLTRSKCFLVRAFARPRQKPKLPGEVSTRSKMGSIGLARDNV